jgi:hypothetical protein
MPVNECIPVMEAAYTQKMTIHADAALFGKRFCGPLTTYQSGPLGLAADPLAAGDGSNLRTAGLPSAGGEVGGVVMWDVAAGAKAGVIRGAGTILPLISGAAVTAGQELQADAAGKVIPFSAGRKIGKAHSTVAGADLDVVVELYATPAA